MHSNICGLFSVFCLFMSRSTKIFQIDTTCAELQTSINQRRSGCKYIEAAAIMRLWEETRVPPAGRLTVLLSRTLGGSLCLCRGWGLGHCEQWPGIGSVSQFWAWHTADETGWRQSSTCMFGQLFAWTLEWVICIFFGFSYCFRQGWMHVTPRNKKI